MWTQPKRSKRACSAVPRHFRPSRNQSRRAYPSLAHVRHSSLERFRKDGRAPNRQCVLSIHSPDDLLYSMSKGGSNGKVGPFVGKVSQIILDNKAFINQVQLFGGALTVQLHAEREVLDDSRIRVTFRETVFKIFGREVTRKPTKGQGEWEMLYVEAAGPEGSASLRVMNTPSLFVLRQRAS